MTQKRLQHLAVDGALLTSLALGSPASAGAATDSGSSSTAATPQASSGGRLSARGSRRAPEASAHETAQTGDTGHAAAKASAPPLTTGRGGSVGAMNHARDGRVRDRYLTDHEQYVRHHQRLASQV
jgi:hypothetical protein